MVAAGCLPTCIRDNKLYFLFGQESPVEMSAKGWSDFAGSMEKGEKNIYNTAIREMAEETSGFLGGPTEINKLIKNNGGFMKCTFDNSGSPYHTHIFRMDHDEKLITYYNANHKYLYDNLNHELLKSTKVFEKIKLEWFTIDMMKKRRKDFRGFYKTIVDQLILNSDIIEKFTRSKKKI